MVGSWSTPGGHDDGPRSREGGVHCQAGANSVHTSRGCLPGLQVYFQEEKTGIQDTARRRRPSCPGWPREEGQVSPRPPENQAPPAAPSGPPGEHCPRPWRTLPVPTTGQGGATELHAPRSLWPGDPTVGGQGKPPPPRSELNPRAQPAPWRLDPSPAASSIARPLPCSPPPPLYPHPARHLRLPPPPRRPLLGSSARNLAPPSASLLLSLLLSPPPGPHWIPDPSSSPGCAPPPSAAPPSLRVLPPARPSAQSGRPRRPPRAARGPSSVPAAAPRTG